VVGFVYLWIRACHEEPETMYFVFDVSLNYLSPQLFDSAWSSICVCRWL
jgi:hypothetical protein